MIMKFKFGDRDGQDCIDWIHSIAAQYDMTDDDFGKLMSLYCDFEETYRRYLIAQVYIQKLENTDTSH